MPVETEKSSNQNIFVQIASYRDPELLNTLEDLFQKAKYPENLRVCIAWQHSVEDEWDNLDKYQDDSRFVILDIDYKESKGACWARNQIQQNYGGEEYTLQLDSHHRFIENWDEELIGMYKTLQDRGYSKPLITAYLPSFFPGSEVKTEEIWKMDFNRFTPEGYIFTSPSLVENWRALREPFPARFYSAHFAFTTGQFCLEVKHDPYLYFHGEEPSIAARAFTWGYDLFHPHKIIAWHEYTRDGKRKHWDDSTTWNQIDKASYQRYRLLHGMEETDCSPCLKKSIGEFGFGEVRSLKDYEIYIGVRFKDRKVQKWTLDRNPAPNPLYLTEKEYEDSLISVFKHCIDIHKSHFKENDYQYWVVSFELNDGTVLNRVDASESEVKTYLDSSDEWIRIWREYQGQWPEKWVVWPYSKSKGFVERLEGQL